MTLAALVEHSFRQSFARSVDFESAVQARALFLFCQNEPPTADLDAPHLPAILFRATEKAPSTSIVVGGRPATDGSIEIECRVAANQESSAEGIEALATQARSVAEEGPVPEGWRYLWLNFTGDERGFENNCRVITLNYEFTALPLV